MFTDWCLPIFLWQCPQMNAIGPFWWLVNNGSGTVYPKKYGHSFVVLCFVVVMQSFIMNSHELFIHIHQGCFAGTGAIVRLPQCQWSKPDGCGKISQCITTTKHSKAKIVCIFLGIYTTWINVDPVLCPHMASSGHDEFIWWRNRYYAITYLIEDIQIVETNPCL